MNLEVRDALYRAFADDYGREEVLMWTQAHLGARVPVEFLSWEHLELLEDTTMLYSVSLLRAVLPRWLELLCDDEAPHWEVDKGSLVFLLNLKKWLEWPKSQGEALRGVFLAWRDAHLCEGTMSEFVEFINEIEDDASRYLDVWLRGRPLEVARWAWENSWARPSILRSWLVLPHVENKWEELFFRRPEGQQAQLLSDVIQLVRSLRAMETRQSAA